MGTEIELWKRWYNLNFNSTEYFKMNVYFQYKKRSFFIQTNLKN